MASCTLVVRYAAACVLVDRPVVSCALVARTGFASCTSVGRVFQQPVPWWPGVFACALVGRHMLHRTCGTGCWAVAIPRWFARLACVAMFVALQVPVGSSEVEGVPTTCQVVLGLASASNRRASWKSGWQWYAFSCAGHARAGHLRGCAWLAICDSDSVSGDLTSSVFERFLCCSVFEQWPKPLQTSSRLLTQAGTMLLFSRC